MSDTLEQHRRELDATFELLVALRSVGDKSLEVDRELGRQIAELRSELRALSNRIEAIARRDLDDNARHSMRADLRLGTDSLVVVDLEPDPHVTLGALLVTGDETVGYVDGDGVTRTIARDRVALVSPIAAGRLARASRPSS